MHPRNDEARVWVYAIASPSTDELGTSTPEPTTILGFENQPIVWIFVGKLLVAISDSQSTRCEEQIDQYHNICTALCKNHDSLPMRFGTQLTYGQLRSQLSTYESSFLTTLASIKGCCEIAVRWAITESEIDCPVSETLLTSSSNDGAIALQERKGTTYLLNKHLHSKREQSAKLAAIECGELLEAEWPIAIRNKKTNTRRLSVAHNPTLHSNSNQVQYIVIELTLLVQKCSAQDVIESARVQKVFDRTPVVVTGPWPPFSFATV